MEQSTHPDSCMTSYVGLIYHKYAVATASWNSCALHFCSFGVKLQIPEQELPCNAEAAEFS